MQYIGIIAVMLSALVISREYARYMKKRELECEAFLEFIAHLRIQLGCFLRPLREAAAGFSSEALERVGFLGAVGSAESICKAYGSVKKRLSLSEAESRPLEALFSSLGSGYLEDELKLIDICEAEMRDAAEKIKVQSPKNIKLISTLSVTAAIGFFILVI